MGRESSKGRGKGRSWDRGRGRAVMVGAEEEAGEVADAGSEEEAAIGAKVREQAIKQEHYL